jgi:transposase InsO family protein
LFGECVAASRGGNLVSRDHEPGLRVVADWLDRYDTDRPHSGLGYLTPKEYREKLAA